MVLLQQVVYPIFLATVAFASLVPRPESDVTIDSSNDPTFADISSGTVVYQYADLISAPKPEDKFTNQTAVVSGVSGRSQGPNQAIIRMTGPVQHIGELDGQDLYDTIHDALLKLCPYDRGNMGCYRGMNGLPSEVTINNVPYKTDKGNYATNAWVTIRVDAVFRELKYPGIGAALYEMAAGAYMQATIMLSTKMANCYDETFNKGSRMYRFCNVPRSVMIALPADKGKVTEAFLRITVEFNGHTKNGKFDFEKTSDAVSRFFEAPVLTDIVRAMGTSEADWRAPCVVRDDGFACDDLYGWRDCAMCEV